MSTTGLLTTPEKQEYGTDDDLSHITCCSDYRALCGANVTSPEFCSRDEVSCTVCLDLADEPCCTDCDYVPVLH